MNHKFTTKSIWSNITADLQGYAGSDTKPWSATFLKRVIREAYIHPGLLAVLVYRYGQWLLHCFRVPGLRQLLLINYYLGVYNWVRFRLHIEIDPRCEIGPGFHIRHYGGIIIHKDFKAGKKFNINCDVLIGSKDGVPQCGDCVIISTGTKMFGKITLGNNVFVGASAVVDKSFPDNAIIAGVPAKVLRFREPKPQSSASSGMSESDLATAEVETKVI